MNTLSESRVAKGERKQRKKARAQAHALTVARIDGGEHKLGIGKQLVKPHVPAVRQNKSIGVRQHDNVAGVLWRIDNNESRVRMRESVACDTNKRRHSARCSNTSVLLPAARLFETHLAVRYHRTIGVVEVL